VHWLPCVWLWCDLTSSHAQAPPEQLDIEPTSFRARNLSYRRWDFRTASPLISRVFLMSATEHWSAPERNDAHCVAPVIAEQLGWATLWVRYRQWMPEFDNIYRRSWCVAVPDDSRGFFTLVLPGVVLNSGRGSISGQFLSYLWRRFQPLSRPKAIRAWYCSLVRINLPLATASSCLAYQMRLWRRSRFLLTRSRSAWVNRRGGGT